MRNRLRWGVAGMGRGRFLLNLARMEAFAGRMTVSAVCDIRRDRAEAAAREFGVPRVCDRLDDLLAADVDAVFVATPDHLHAAHAIAALRAGKHVLSEIPMAATREEVAEILSLAAGEGADSDRPYYAMGNEVRWLPVLQAVKRMGEDGFWGPIFYSEAEYLHNLRREGWREREPEGSPHWRFDPAHPQTTLLGGGPHAFDTIRWLTGETGYTEAFAYGVGTYVPGHPEPHTVIALLRGRSGAVCKITVSYAMARPYCLYCSLYGERGTFEVGRARQGESYYFSEKIPYLADMTRLDVPFWSRPGAGGAGHGTSEHDMLLDFLDAVRDGRPPLIDACEAARSILPAVCALESLETGAPVAVPQV
jgi:UDP-N-acetyl-2-amino-2-deoxyglucuronate dehydrogenase